jgi:hypothetical protein
LDEQHHWRLPGEAYRTAPEPATAFIRTGRLEAISEAEFAGAGAAPDESTDP